MTAALKPERKVARPAAPPCGGCTVPTPSGNEALPSPSPTSSSSRSSSEDDLDEEVVGEGEGSASFPLGVGTVQPPQGGAAGLATFLSGFKAAVMNVLNFTTYYEMKARAGNVGKNGVAKLVDKLAPQVQRIHLIGHSFGGRVVTATAANSSTDKIKSMSL